MNVKAADAWNVNPHACFISCNIHFECPPTQFYCVQNFSNVSSISLSAMLEMYFYFCKESGIIQRGRGESERQCGHLPLDFHKNEGLFGLQWPYFVSETLLHYCSTQLKVLTNVFCLKYCTEVIYVDMYSFMNVFPNTYTRTECKFFLILFAICLFEDFPGTSPALVQASPTCTVILYVFFFVFISCSLVERSMSTVWRNAFLFI